MTRADAPSADSNVLAANAKPAAVAGDSLQQTRCSCSTRRRALGRSRRAIAANASSSARKNSEVSAGTDAAAGLGMGGNFEEASMTTRLPVRKLSSSHSPELLRAFERPASENLKRLLRTGLMASRTLE